MKTRDLCHAEASAKCGSVALDILIDICLLRETHKPFKKENNGKREADTEGDYLLSQRKGADNP